MEGTIHRLHRLRRWLKADQSKGFLYNLQKSATSADKLFDGGEKFRLCDPTPRPSRLPFGVKRQQEDVVKEIRDH